MKNKTTIFLNVKFKTVGLLIAILFSFLSKATVASKVVFGNTENQKVDQKQASVFSAKQTNQNPFFEFDLENDEEDDDDKNSIHFLVPKAFEIVDSENKFRVAHKLYCQSYISNKRLPFFILYQNPKVFS